MSTQANLTIGGRFHLTDHFGSQVTEATYSGSYLIVFFGFTHCRVVCPRALKRLETVLRHLGPLADRIQPLYITVDPDRDTPSVMKAFLEPHYPRVIGLTGTKDEIDTVKRAYRVFAERKSAEDGNYDVPHTAITYLMSPNGDYVTHFSDVVGEEEMGSKLRQIVSA